MPDAAGSSTAEPTAAGLVYRAVDGFQLQLDVFAPPGAGQQTAVLHLHGGGWRAGSRESVHGRCRELASHGFTCFAVSYRLLPQAPWPAALTDVQAAISWVAAHAAEWAIDPARIVLQGYSAGAHLALLAATKEQQVSDPPVAAVVAAYPVTEFYPTGAEEVGTRPSPPREAVPAWLLYDRATTSDEAAAVSPLRLADAAFPPTLIIHGTADRIRPHESSIAFHARLLELGIIADLRLYGGQNHEFDDVPSFRAAVQRDVAFFLRRTVADRDAIDADVAAHAIF